MVKIANPIFPLNRVIGSFARQATTQLEVNFMKQRIWPTEVYSGYAVVNEKRKEMGSWHSTGAGARSFHGVVNHADKAGNVQVTFSYLEYLKFVDLGVGQGTKIEDVESSKKAYYTRRYISSWNRRRGMSQRPAIMMEMRHLQKRIADHLADYYGYEGEVQIVNTLADLPEIKLI